MAWFKLNRLQWVALMHSVTATTGFISGASLAVLWGHSTPYLPFISEGGCFLPEKYVFVFILSMAAFFNVISVSMAHALNESYNTDQHKAIQSVNWVGTVFAHLATLGLVLLFSFEMCISIWLHLIGASMLIGGSLVSGIARSWTSFQFCPKYNGLYLCLLRASIMTLAVFVTVVIGIGNIIGILEWGEISKEHWIGRKTPEDKGFIFFFIASIAEWIVGFCYVSFYATYIWEFKNVKASIRIIKTAKKLYR